jgi:hypothetical protein
MDTILSTSPDNLSYKHKVFVAAYAASIVVLAWGIVALVLMLAALCFFFPEKVPAAATAMVVLAGPLIALIVAHIKTTIALMNGP